MFIKCVIGSYRVDLTSSSAQFDYKIIKEQFNRTFIYAADVCYLIKQIEHSSSKSDLDLQSSPVRRMTMSLLQHLSCLLTVLLIAVCGGWTLWVFWTNSLELAKHKHNLESITSIVTYSNTNSSRLQVQSD